MLLDLDGTLLDLHFDNYFWLQHIPRRYAERHALAPEHARALLHQRFKALQGTMQWYCLDHWGAELRLDILALKREVQHLIAPRPNVGAFLSALNDAGKQVVLTTNAHPHSLALKMQRVPLQRHFDAVRSSHQYNCPKESEAFWEALDQDLEFERSRTLFVDDNDAVLDAAQRFGIARVFGIRQPDSRGVHIDRGPYRRLHDFNELLPI